MQDFIFNVYCQRISRQSKYQVTFSYNLQLIDRIKNLPQEQRKYNKDNNYWEITTRGLYSLIKSYKGSTKLHFDFGEEEGRKEFKEQIKKIDAEEIEKERIIKELNEKKIYWYNFKEDLENNYEQYIDIIHKNLKPEVKLYTYQVCATIFLNKVKNVLLALDMGTGKSIISIAYIEMNDFKKVLVITPNSLKFNYYNEVEKFTNSKAYIINWNKNKYTIEESKYIIINYDFFNSSNKEGANKKYFNLNIDDKIECIIVDECQKIKNTKNNIYKNYKRFFSRKQISKVFMSGTPMCNRTYELYSVLNQISPIEFPTKKFFYEYYCGMTYDSGSDYGGWISIGDIKFEELYNKISPYTYRKRKEEILPDLPDKTYQKILLELNEKEKNIYDEIESGIANEFIADSNLNPLTRMLRLRQYTSSLKIKNINDIIDEIIDNNEKVVIIDVFKDVLNEIHEKYKNISVLHTGDFSVSERNEMVTIFQDENSNIKIFLGTISTANFGLTLTAASKMLLLTLPYSVGEYDQISDRIHRIGQKNSVMIYPIIYIDTIDEYVFDLLEKKMIEITKTLDNKEYNTTYVDVTMNDIINKLKEKYV